MDRATELVTRAMSLCSASRNAIAVSTQLRARSEQLRVRCDVPGCCHGPALHAQFFVRCTVGTKRSAIRIPLPVVVCHRHHGTPTLVRSMRRYAPLLLTDILAGAGIRWPDWQRARVVYSRKTVPDLDRRAA